MTMPLPWSGRGSHVTELPKFKDAPNSVTELIMKYQLYFTRYFGPKYAYGVQEVIHTWSGDLQIVARVSPPHTITKGKTCHFNVKMAKFRIWRDNLRLYNFVSSRR